jgi:hypothetical protein
MHYHIIFRRIPVITGSQLIALLIKNSKNSVLTIDAFNTGKRIDKAIVAIREMAEPRNKSH